MQRMIVEDSIEFNGFIVSPQISRYRCNPEKRSSQLPNLRSLFLVATYAGSNTRYYPLPITISSIGK
jgi:hypothetical protein